LLEASSSDRLDEHFGAVRERLWSEVLGGVESAQEDLSGQRFGRWRIEGRIARGGLATVYLARRDDGEFDQKAAFKVLRRGLDTDDVVTRFRAERQILSSLDHPAIAKILDGGALPDGRPFLVLEYVNGKSITAYCDEREVDVRGRVRLIIDVLRGLHFAHKHTIVHRDIKPSNILVSTEGNAVLLDFGIAKLLDPDLLPGSSTLTRTGVSLLTPGYGSPEQLAGEPVTTASDIYQAGAVLFELLTGRRPDVLRPSGISDSAPPSRHLAGSPRLAQVRGDLDAIVQTAMQAESSRRYGSASEMVADLERYLDGRPVAAHPDTLVYRIRKLSKRRPWLFPVAAFAVLAVAAYVVTLTVYSSQLRIEERRSDAAQAFMVDLVSSPDPFAPADPERGRNITVVEALDLGRVRLENELADQPELQASLLGTLAGVYRSLDQNDDAIELGEQALALNLALYGESSEAVLANRRLLGAAYAAVGDYERAQDSFDRQLAAALRQYDADDPRLGLAETGTGAFDLSQGKPEEGLRKLRQGIERLRKDPGAYPDELISAAVTYTFQEGMGDPAESLALLEDALAVATSAYGDNSLYTANVLIAMGRARVEMRDFTAARAKYETGLAIYDSQLGPNHADTVIHYNNYGFLLLSAGDFAGAEAIHRTLVDRFIVLRGENHKLVADNYQNLAGAISRQGRFDEALPLHRKAYEVYLASGWDHYRTVYPLLSIAYIEIESGDAAAAESAAMTALERFREAVPGSYLEGVAQCLVGLAREQQGDVATGGKLLRQSHPLMQQVDLSGTPYPALCRLPAPTDTTG
jgi:serine/threonine-protein kinase